MCMNMCADMCRHVNGHAYGRTHEGACITYVYLHVCTYLRVRIDMCTDMRTELHIDVCAYVRIAMHTDKCTCMHAVL